jgi:hypothetical protein
MAIINPDKYVRLSVYTKLNNIVVDGKIIPCYDTRVTGNSSIKHYILMTSQTKNVDKATKCGNRWDTSLLIEIYTSYPTSGNTGSRVFLNNIEEAVYNLLDNISINNFEVVKQTLNTEQSNLETVTNTENIFRSFVRLNLTLI